MMNLTNYEKQFFEFMTRNNPIPPQLWQELKTVLEIKKIKKNRYLTAEQFDLHYILDGMIIKRIENNGEPYEEVVDFISSNNLIYHIEKMDHSSFEADIDSTVILIRNSNLSKVLEKHPIFLHHLEHLFGEVLLRRSYRGKLIHLTARERILKFKEDYPEAYKYCSVNDKSSFLGMTAAYYSNINI
ncbi:hypothetical protein [Sphingobacterium faecium]|uniref:hypothetical protein n=1 Tax=Sphingobacterium faecium TaxID=34087 RepID=UPI00320A6C97